MKLLRKIKDIAKRTPLYEPYRRFRWHEKMKQAAREFQRWGPVDEKRAAFYRQFVDAGDLVFDVGANLGNRSKVFSRLGARVVAFEPQTDCHQFLTTIFAGSEAVRIVNQALGRTEGTTEMFLSDSHVLSSLSQAWIHAVDASKRFEGAKWDRRQQVHVSTLDRAIGDFGRPAFIKIDVEGFEFEVLSGLSRPVECVSFEFTPEYIQNTLSCIDHVGSLSAVELQYSIGESMTFAADRWLVAEEMKQVLCNVQGRNFGDVYIRRIR